MRFHHDVLVKGLIWAWGSSKDLHRRS